jgi:beta-lactamase class A
MRNSTRRESQPPRRLLLFLLPLVGVLVLLTLQTRRLDPLSDVKDAAPAMSVTFEASAAGRDGRSPEPLILAEDLPLADAVREYLRERDGDVAIFLHSDDGYELSVHGTRRMRLASLAKPLIMVGFLQQAEDPSSAVALTDYDRALLEDMIGFSDNDATDALLSEVDAERLTDFLSSKGVRGARSGDIYEWGDWRASPSGIARLLWDLWGGKLLDEDGSELARDLLADIAFDQRWGVTAGLPDEADVALKNGWYGDDDGWRVHTAGVVHDGHRSYVLVIMTSENPSFDYGQQTVEDLATMINASLSLAAGQAGVAAQRQSGS